MKGEREARLSSALRWLISLIVIAALVSVTYFTFSYYVDLSHARTTLYNAKTTRLAAWSVATQCYGGGEKFSDMSSDSGFADGISENIAELSQCSGLVRLIRTRDNGYGIAELTYSEGGFTVCYKSDGKNDTWQVYKQSVYITS